MWRAEREAAHKDGGDVGADEDSSEEASEATELAPVERDEVSSDEEGDEEQYWKKVPKKGCRCRCETRSL